MDETQVWVHGEAWWLWVAFNPHSRAILRMGLSPTRSGLSALLFLLRLRGGSGVRAVYTNGGVWYPWAAQQARLRHVLLDRTKRNPWERGLEAIRDPLRGFDAHFPCRCRGKGHVRAFLDLYRLWYNHVRDHLGLGRPPIPVSEGDEWQRFQNLFKEVILN